MTQKQKISSMAALIGAAILSLGAPAQAQTEPQGAVTLTLPQARELAAQALEDREPLIAAQLATGLLKADPKSSYAHFILAHAQAQLGKGAAARRAAALSYRNGENKAERFRAAELAAKLAYAQGRPTTAQLWLRRAAQNAANDQVEDQLGLDYNRVRSENPLAFSLRGAVRPSNNVNNGSDTARQIIDGQPFIGTLSGSAQALSGVIASADGALSYRLRGTRAARTEIAARLFVNRVTLSSEAKRLSPTSSNGDFGSTYAAVTLSHSFRVGPQGNSARMAVTAGQLWSGGDRYYDFAKVEGSHVWRLDAAHTFRLAASIEDRDLKGSTTADSLVLGLNASYSYKRQSGDRLSFSLDLQNANSTSVNSDSTALTVRARYAFAQKIGPAQVSAGLVLGTTEYDEYFAAPIFLSDGRQDKSAYADLNLFFDDLDYAGFAPTLTLRTGRKSSNISRFDTREFSVSVGVASKF